MFENDLDIDFEEVPSNSQSSSSNLKRQSSEPVIKEQNKKPKKSLSTDDISEENSISNLNSVSSSDSFILPSIKNTNSELKNKFHFKKTIKTSPAGGSLIKPFQVNIGSDILSSSTTLQTHKRNGDISKFSEIHHNFEKKLTDRIYSKDNSSPEVNISKRKFPGPAGLLPEQYSENFNLGESVKINISETKEEICSQSYCLVLSEGPWQKMRLDFLPKLPGDIYLPDKYNIQWIKSRTSMRKLINQKAPFLAAFIHSINSHSTQNPIVNLTLKDKTGTIQGTILHNLYEKYSNELLVGSVIVLKEVGVLNTGSKNEPFLTITSNNLISIYPTTCKPGNTTDIIESDQYKIIVQNIKASDLCSSISESKRLHKIEMMNSRNIHTVMPSSSIETITSPNICSNFKKAILNINNRQHTGNCKPNLNNLTTNLSLKNKASLKCKILESNVHSQNEGKSFHKISFIKQPDNCRVTENITDIKDLFSTQEDLDDFFNEEPNFCSTQISSIEEPKLNSTENSVKIDSNQSKCNEQISKDSEKENRLLIEDMLEGLDTDALFNDF